MKKLLFIFVSFLMLTKSFATDKDAHSLLIKNPQLDLTDVFVFKAATPGKTVFIMDFNPESKVDALSNYSEQGIYRFCIGDDANFTHGLSPTFTFKNNQIQLYMANHAEPAIDELGTFIGEGPISKELEFSNGIKIWTGTVYDMFVGNVPGFEIFRERAKKGIYDLTSFDITSKANLSTKNISSVIVLEIPNNMLPDQLYYYATTAIENNDKWYTIRRVGHVLFSQLYIFDDETMITYLNSKHNDEAKIKNEICEIILNYVTVAGLQRKPEKYVDKLLTKIYPDVLTYKVGSDATYSVDQINGRPLQVDAINVALAMLVGSEVPIDDNVGINLNNFQDKFPYVVPLGENYNQAIYRAVQVQAEPVNLLFDKHEHKIVSKKSKTFKNQTFVFIGAFILLVLGFGLRIKKRMHK
ncbi:DUF4331 domain-containing protein [Flavobacterium agricola]|uniref:DUF4331 domain-containing protein n=1 Tax=Flavobacterium agricola TaxID=2870839 RepID=A0ABY6M1F2_9FLAO|nr:DUF4331 domain-containing protein [Flavobacterium agricola]UYW00698.1 DUF4331 domain-containing protein [Flavobacterium agricola]